MKPMIEAPGWIRHVWIGLLAPMVLLLLLTVVRLIQHDAAGLETMAAAGGTYVVLAAPVLAWINRRSPESERAPGYCLVLLALFGASLAVRGFRLVSGWTEEAVMGGGLLCVLGIGFGCLRQALRR